MMLISCCFFVSAEPITVIYPNVKAPYDEIFRQITSGVESEYAGDVIHLKLPMRFDPKTIVPSIKTDKVIALGKRGLAVAKRIYKTKSVLVGALPIKPNGIAGVSLMAAPEKLFNSLNELAPNIETIIVLYTDRSAWIIDSANEVAKEKGLTLNPVHVDNLKGAIKSYNEIFKQKDLDKTAIWLTLDPVTANDKIILPEILEQAWEHKMVVFSSKPTHAKRGALFSAMPDNVMLGKQLASLLNTVNYTQSPSSVEPLNEIKLAVNLRTAAHLGYKYGTKARQQFAITFPK